METNQNDLQINQKGNQLKQALNQQNGKKALNQPKWQQTLNQLKWRPIKTRNISTK